MNDSVKGQTYLELKCCRAHLHSRIPFIVHLMYHTAGILVQYKVQIPVIFYEVHMEQCGLVEVLLPTLFGFLQLLDISPLISTHTACLTW